MKLLQRTPHPVRLLGSTLPALLLSGALASAQEPEKQEEIESLKTSIDSLQKQIDELKRTQLAQPRVSSSEATMTLFGRIQFDFWTFPQTDDAIDVFETGDPDLGPQSRVEFRRARLGVKGKIVKDMIYKIEIDFGKPNRFAFKDMYIGFEDLPWSHTLMMGNQKRPYGLDTLNSSRYNIFLERPMVGDAFNLNARRFGIAATGLSEEKSWSWRFGVFNMNDWAEVGTISSYTVQPEFAGRVAHTPWFDEASGGRNYLHLAVSGTWAFPDGSPSEGDAPNEARFRTRPEGRSSKAWIDTGRISGTDSYAMMGLEALVNLGPTQIAAEYMHSWLDRNSGQEGLQFGGGYLYISHFLTGDFMPWNRKYGTLGMPKPIHDLGGGHWGAWQLAARYSFADFSDKDILGGQGNALTLGLNWWWNPKSRLQFNYIAGRISDRSVDVGGTIYSEGDYQILGLRVMVDF